MQRERAHWSTVSIYRFVLYVGGDLGAVARTVGAVREQLAGRAENSWTLEVVDLDVDPRVAADAGVSGTATLLRVAPGPQRRWMGDEVRQIADSDPFGD
jgi:hypothetical protein